jgi:hypothetical protein
MANIISDAVGIFALPATKRQPKAEGGEDVKDFVDRTILVLDAAILVWWIVVSAHRTFKEVFHE